MACYGKSEKNATKQNQNQNKKTQRYDLVVSETTTPRPAQSLPSSFSTKHPIRSVTATEYEAHRCGYRRRGPTKERSRPDSCRNGSIHCGSMGRWIDGRFNRFEVSKSPSFLKKSSISLSFSQWNIIWKGCFKRSEAADSDLKSWLSIVILCYSTLYRCHPSASFVLLVTPIRLARPHVSDERTSQSPSSSSTIKRMGPAPSAGILIGSNLV